MLNVCRVGIYQLKNLVGTNFIAQQVRTTFVLKRKWQPFLHKTNQRNKLRAKHFVYDLVEDTLVKSPKPLEVVLTTFVEGIGDKGDVVALKPHFVYNKLLLPGLAVYKTKENIKKYEKTEEDKKTVLHSSPYAQRTVNMLERRILAVIMNKNVPWVIEPWHIRASLRKAGCHVTDESITLPETPIEGPDLKKEGKDFYVTITVNKVEKARVKCRIHHWSTDPSERLPYVFEHWKEPGELLFE